MQAGEIFEARYRVEREVGRGSFGVVYLVEDLQTGQLLAIKVLLPWIKRDPALQHRLKREAKLTAMLTSPHALRIYDLQESSTGEIYLVMEYLEGRELVETLKAQKTLPPARVANIARQVLEALGESHALGVIHRDVKPHNVFILDGHEADEVKVLDFGIAKVAGLEDGKGLAETTRLTKPGGVLGTPAYMSPEQCRGEHLTPASDFYSLGIVLYEMLTGRVPFSHDNSVQVLMMHNLERVPPLPAEVADTPLGRAVMKALEKDPTRRFTNAAEFAAAIESDASPVSAAPTSTDLASPVAAITTPASVVTNQLPENRPAVVPLPSTPQAPAQPAIQPARPVAAPAATPIGTPAQDVIGAARRQGAAITRPAAPSTKSSARINVWGYVVSAIIVIAIVVAILSQFLN